MKLEIKKHEKAVGGMSLSTHDILLNGVPVEGQRLRRVVLDMPAGELSTVSLEYHGLEFDIVTDVAEPQKIGHFMGLEVRDLDSTSKVIDGLRSLGNSQSEVLSYLVKNDLIADKDIAAAKGMLSEFDPPRVTELKKKLYSELSREEKIEAWDLGLVRGDFKE